MTTLRMPRGLWDDFESTVIRQDSAWLTHVAREVGLPPAEVIRKVLGTGAPQLALISAEPLDPCPWYTRLGAGLWMPCKRQRIRPAGPCQFHERPTPNTSISVDGVGKVKPYLFNGRIYWSSEEPDADIFREDGTLETGFRFHTYIGDDGEKHTKCVSN